jgi:hypothetical protein
MLKSRSYAEIQREQLKYEAVNTLAESSNMILETFQGYDVFEFSKEEQNKHKGVCLQRLIKEVYTEYNGKCDIPELRYQIFSNGNVTLHVIGKSVKSL